MGLWHDPSTSQTRIIRTDLDNVKTAGFGALFVRRLVHVQLWVQNLVRSIALCIACIGELNYSYDSKARPFRQV